ncbi:hypothetical protein D3C73_633110 [compost metagenome]
MPDFNSLLKMQDTFPANRAALPFLCCAEIRHMFQSEIPARHHMAQVEIPFSGSGNSFTHCSYCLICQQSQSEPNRSNKTALNEGRSLYSLRISQSNFTGSDIVPDLDLIYLMIPANEHGKDFASALIDQRLDHLFRFNLQLLFQLINRADSRGVKFLGSRQSAGVPLNRLRLCHCMNFSLLQVSGIITCRTYRNRIFAYARYGHEFMGFPFASYRPGIGLHRPVDKTAAVKNPLIRLIHPAVCLIEPFPAGVKRVGILHQELSPPHQTGTGTALIAEFGLDLIDGNWQFPVRANFAPHKRSDDLFMGWPQHKFTVMTVAQLHQFFSVDLIALRCLPQLCRLHGRHQHFLRTGGVHFLPHDSFNLAQDPPPQGQIRINSGCQLADISGTQQQLVVNGLRLRRRFPQGGC